jgi:hypothetical protein
LLAYVLIMVWPFGIAQAHKIKLIVSVWHHQLHLRVDGG